MAEGCGEEEDCELPGLGQAGLLKPFGGNNAVSGPRKAQMSDESSPAPTQSGKLKELAREVEAVEGEAR